MGFMEYKTVNMNSMGKYLQTWKQQKTELYLPRDHRMPKPEQDREDIENRVVGMRANVFFVSS